MLFPMLFRAVGQLLLGHGLVADPRHATDLALALHSQPKESRFFLSASRIGTLDPSGTPSSSFPLSSAFSSSLFLFSWLWRRAAVALLSSSFTSGFEVATGSEDGAAPAFGTVLSGSEDLRPGSLSRMLSVYR